MADFEFEAALLESVRKCFYPTPPGHFFFSFTDASSSSSPRIKWFGQFGQIRLQRSGMKGANRRFLNLGELAVGFQAVLWSIAPQ